MKNKNFHSAIVLCGGMSRRMGEDKGSMIINKKPMILHLLETLNNQIDEVILVLNDGERIAKYKEIIQNYFDKKSKYFSYDLIFLEDEVKNQGPLSGIMTGLENISSNYALVLPCDSPFIDNNFVNFMFDCLDGKIANDFGEDNSKNSYLNNDIDFNLDAIVPYHYKNKKNEDINFENNNDFFLNNENEIIKKFLLNNSEPLHSIYKKNISKEIKKLLNSNIRDVKSLLKRVNSYFILIDDENTFKNVNTKEDI